MRRFMIATEGLFLTVAIGVAVAAGGQAQVPGTFRSAITLVPVDVRVIDRKTNKPVTDLRQDDFTVFENGVKQAIGHFSCNTLTPSICG